MDSAGIHSSLISFIRKALKEDSVCIFPDDWRALIKESGRQGVSAVVFDGHSRCYDRGEVMPEKDMPDAMKKKRLLLVYGQVSLERILRLAEG